MKHLLIHTLYFLKYYKNTVFKTVYRIFNDYTQQLVLTHKSIILNRTQINWIQLCLRQYQLVVSKKQSALKKYSSLPETPINLQTSTLGTVTFNICFISLFLNVFSVWTVDFRLPTLFCRGQRTFSMCRPHSHFMRASVGWTSLSFGSTMGWGVVNNNKF